MKGHKNSKGESAPWVIRDENSGNVLSSHKTKGEAEKHLKQMKYFKYKKSSSNDSLKDFVISMVSEVISLYREKHSKDFFKICFHISSLLYSLLEVIEHESNKVVYNEMEQFLQQLQNYMQEPENESKYADVHQLGLFLYENLIALDMSHISQIKKIFIDLFESLDILKTISNTNVKVSYHVKDKSTVLLYLQELIDKSFHLEDFLQGATSSDLLLVDNLNVQIREILLNMVTYFLNLSDETIVQSESNYLQSFLYTTDILLDLFLNFEYLDKDIPVLIQTWLKQLQYFSSKFNLPNIETNINNFTQIWLKLERINKQHTFYSFS